MLYLKALKNMLILIFFTIIFKPFFFLNKKEIWFFIDRPFWIDNSYFLYKYVKKNKKNIRSIYLLKNNKDRIYKELKNDHNIVYNLSIKHLWYFIHAKNIIFSFDTKPFLFYKQWLVFKSILKPKANLIFLQHWVTKWNIKPYSKKYTKFDLFFSVWNKEKNIIENLWYHQEVKITWFPRFDNLINFKTKNQIMFMPSWNMELYWKTEKEFKKSKYFKWINNLLNSDQLNIILKKNNLKLIFIPHYMMNKYIHLFNIEKDTNIKIINSNTINKENDVQKIMKESKLLITDYSSIMFDFAYMKKPSIYYRFENHHYQELFNVENDGFWKIIYDLEKLIVEIKKNIKNDFNLEKKYIKWIENFFYKIDWNNCKRNYNEIIKYNNK